jgi:hypothetical protein
MLEDVSSGNEAGIHPENTDRNNRDYFNIDMMIAWRSGAIANRHINPKVIRQMQIESYKQNQQNK